MKKIIGLSLGLCCLMSAGAVMSAQDDAGVNGPPKILVIQREFLKPGKAGSLHDKSESAFVAAMKAAKSTDHYFGMTSLSGPSRALYFAGYSSYASWEAAAKTVEHNRTLSAALDRASIADGDLLTSYEQSIWEYNKDLSLNDQSGLGNMRYMELTLYKIKPGHRKEWNELVAMYKKAMADVPSAHWATFEMAFGGTDREFLVATAMKSASEIDQQDADSDKFVASMGADGMKKIADLTAEAVESSGSSLYMFNPKMSYPPEEWVKADPGFWSPKTEPMGKKKAEESKK